MITMNIDVTADAFQDMLKRYPREMSKSIELFADEVGASIEREAKWVMQSGYNGTGARSKTGNLARNIVYSDRTIGSFMSEKEYGSIVAHANYSKYVHGKPFYNNSMRRKENPFFTTAVDSLDLFIKKEAQDAVKRVLE